MKVIGKVFEAKHNGRKIVAYHCENLTHIKYRVYIVNGTSKEFIEEYDDFRDILIFAGFYLAR